MDDQQGNVIDGTARARQWRRSRSKVAHGDGEGPAARSNAPKSIAGSLLVPVDMLPAAFPGDEHLNGNEQGAGSGRPYRAGTVTADRVGDDDAAHLNPFLAPEAAAVGSGGRTGRLAWRPRRVSRRAGALITVTVTIALVGLVVTLIDGTASTDRKSATSLATATVWGEPPTLIGDTVRAAITTLSVAGRDVAHRATTARRAARSRRLRHARRHAAARPDRATSVVSRTEPSAYVAPAYTPPPTSTTQAPSTPAAQPAAAPHTSPSPGPTGSDPLGGLGSCVKGC